MPYPRAEAKAPNGFVSYPGTRGLPRFAQANGQNAHGAAGPPAEATDPGTPLPEEGARLIVRTIPEGAAITIDGSPVGMSEVEYGVAEGEHVVEATRKGYLTARRNVNVAAREQQVLSMFLIENRSADSGVGTAKWVTAAGAAGTVIAGVVLLAMGNGERSDAGMRLPDRNNNTTIGAVLLGTGVVLSALTGYLFYRDGQRSDPKEAGTSQDTAPTSAAQKGTIVP